MGKSVIQADSYLLVARGFLHISFIPLTLRTMLKPHQLDSNVLAIV